jgi:hypothetical protein
MTPRSVRHEKPEASLRSIVGEPIYDVWLDMLKVLVPGGRTHRLAPIVAGMLRYTCERSSASSRRRPPHGSLAEALIALDEGDDDAATDLVKIAVGQLFRDAGVRPMRHSRQGQQYSVVDAAIHEFEQWGSMPWE